MQQGSKPRTPGEILRLALEKETEARDLYAGLAAGCSVDFVRDLLEKLANEEGKHMGMVRGMLSRLEAGRDVV